MTKNIYNAFAKKLFGIKYERVGRTLLICFIVFWGLHIAELQIRIDPFVLYFMTAAFTAGVMWQALSSGDNSEYLKNMLMLPFDGAEFTFGYVGALGSYTIVTKTSMLWAVVFAVSSWSAVQIWSSLLCAINAILLASVIYTMKKYRIAGFIWSIGMITTVIVLHHQMLLLNLLFANAILSALYLNFSDGYCFYRQSASVKQLRGNQHASVRRYLFRYLMAHKNYLINSVAMCGVACVLPFIFQRTGNTFALPIGFAILSLNTPLCILLSCAPALEQAVRFLPKQKQCFCIPYCIFIFVFHFMIDVVFMSSWQIQIGGLTLNSVIMAFFFALQSAICSVLLEWFHPIRNWKIESDLWHHPRKYIVPATMLLLAGAIGILPGLITVLVILLIIEIIVLMVNCWRDV